MSYWQLIIILAIIVICIIYFVNYYSVWAASTYSPFPVPKLQWLVDHNVEFKVHDRWPAATGYALVEMTNLLTRNECLHLIALAEKQGLNESEVTQYSESGSAIDMASRTSKTAWMVDQTDPLVAKLSAVSSALCGLPTENHEMLQIASYDVGGRFNPHFDACTLDDETCAKIDRFAGHRRSTLLVYLNDDFQSGETEFVELGHTVIPKQGKAIFFWSTMDNPEESIIPVSKHAGREVKSGKKWICTKWSHNKPYK